MFYSLSWAVVLRGFSLKQWIEPHHRAEEKNCEILRSGFPKACKVSSAENWVLSSAPFRIILFYALFIIWAVLLQRSKLLKKKDNSPRCWPLGIMQMILVPKNTHGVQRSCSWLRTYGCWPMLYLQSWSVPAFLAAFNPVVTWYWSLNELDKIPDTRSFHMCRKVMLVPF